MTASLMRSSLQTLIVAGAFALSATTVRGDSEIVIAIRYLQATGTSHAHLYLYREDGKLLRQLTNDNSGQDVAPIFDSSGETIVFTREKPHKVTEYWTIKPRGEGLKKLDTAPSWYVEAKTSPYFTNLEPETESTPAPSTSPESSESPNESPTPTPSYKSPDGAFELVLREDPNDEADQVDMPGHGAHYILRDLKWEPTRRLLILRDLKEHLEFCMKSRTENAIFCSTGRFAWHSSISISIAAMEQRCSRSILDENASYDFRQTGRRHFHCPARARC